LKLYWNRSIQSNRLLKTVQQLSLLLKLRYGGLIRLPGGGRSLWLVLPVQVYTSPTSTVVSSARVRSVG